MKLIPIFAWIFLAGLAQAKDAPLRHTCPSDGWQNKLLIDVLAVGQGDSTFIRTPSGTSILIDAGNPGRGKRDIVPTLKKCYGVKALDYVVVTHPHNDHFGGFSEVFREFKVKKKIYDTGESDGKAFARYKQAAAKAGVRAIPSLGDGAFETEDKVKIKVVAVNGEVFGGRKVSVFKRNKHPIDKNSVSIAVKISYGKFDYFTGGDLTGGGKGTPDVETPVADAVGSVEVIKSNHHGSATSNNEYFLKTLRPQHIVISVGNGEANKRYHLPNFATIERIGKLPFVLGVFQTAKGEGRSPASGQEKVRVSDGDVLILATPESYSLGGKDFPASDQ